MSAEPEFPLDPTSKRREQVIAELAREIERRRESADASAKQDELDQPPAGIMYELTAEDIANAVPLHPFIDDVIRRLEQS